VKRTPFALPISSGQRVCNIDSKSSHSSADRNVLMKFFANIKTYFAIEETDDLVQNPTGNLVEQEFFYRSVKIAFVVGTILAFINHGELIISGALTAECWIKMGLTCLVPYSVAFWTATRAQMEKSAPA
jgi:hypothetical protein